MIRKRNVKCILSVLLAVSVVCNLFGCGSKNSINLPDVQQTAETPVVQEGPQDTQAGEDLDVVEPSAADDKWYM